MTTTVRVETGEKTAVVKVTNNGNPQPDVKVEPYDAGIFHIYDDMEISVREVKDETLPAEASSEPSAA